jgi:hypothetical protein
MKYLILAPIALLLCSFGINGERKTPETVPNVSVNLIKEDPNLAKGTGMAIFSFQNYMGWIKGDTVRMSYNGTETKVVPNEEGKVYLGMKSGKYKFQFYLNSEHFEITTDSILIKEQWQTGMLVTFENSLYPIEAEKPVIYIYPDATKNVYVHLKVNGTMGFVYPKQNVDKDFPLNTIAWNFTADPDGSIHMGEKQYDYLFYDAQANLNITTIDQSAGFVVRKENLATFFEEKLTAMGLNPREREDFITYWAPQMQQNESSYIHFLFNSEYEQVSDIRITPEPDHLFRIFMLWDDAKGLDTTKIHEQKMESFTREGFTVVEWGGGKVDFISNKQSPN